MKPRQLKLEMSRQLGLSLVELMVGIALSAVIALALTTMISNTSRARSEMAKSNEQIENGRYAIQLLADDLSHAGFYGEFRGADTAHAFPSVTPSDPCVTDKTLLWKYLQFPVQGLNNTTASWVKAADSWTSCKAAATASDASSQVTGTDVLVVRRAHQQAVCDSSSITANEYYLQSEFTALSVQKGGGGFTYGVKNAEGSDSTMCKFYRNPDLACGTQTIAANTTVTCSNATPVSEPKIAATIRKLHVNVYFVSPCNVCSGTADTTPTLKRVVLGPTGYTVEPLVEGIQSLQLEYGVDDTPYSETDTSFGTPDRFVPADDPSLDATTWQNVVAVKIIVLARTKDVSTSKNQNTNVYCLATPQSDGTCLAANKFQPVNTAKTDSAGQTYYEFYKYHLFTETVMLKNPTGMRNLP